MNVLKREQENLVNSHHSFGVILVSSFFASLIQSKGFSVEVTDLRDAENAGVWEVDPEIEVNGKVVSGILFVPKKASKDNKLPAVVLTHGYLNYRELQLQNAIELARRGFVVLTVDREAHGNYGNTGNSPSLMTRGLYDAAKYLYNLEYVDKSRIGISGHSMGGFDTASTLREDALKPEDAPSGKGLGIISAGLIQAWSTYMGAGPNVSVGILKARDDEFFFQSTLPDGTPSIARQYLQSVGAANFVGIEIKDSINVVNGGKYHNGELIEVELGKAAPAGFRAIYEANEIHPQNHFSIESAGYVVDFFYAAFGTPDGYKTIKPSNQVWWIKEGFSFIGLLALLALIFPVVSLILTIPCFAGLKKKKLVTGEGLEVEEDLPKLCGVQKHLSYWIPGVAVMLFGGFILKTVAIDLKKYFPLTQRFPQDTTNWVALWAMICGLFGLAMVILTYVVNLIVNKIRKVDTPVQNPFEVARIGSVSNFLKTLLVAAMTVAALYLVVFINWGIWKTDFRLWTLGIKVFNIPMMFPTMLRYAALFSVYYILSAIGNITYRVKNLPEWASIAINAVFNAFGVLLVILIQYITFRSSGELWQPEMNLSYIVVFPLVAILIFATIISRKLYKKTGNIWLGSLINSLLFTMMTVSATAASFAYILA